MTRRLAGIVAILMVLSGISLLSAQEEKAEDLEVHLYNVKPEETTKKYHNRTETEYRIQQNLYMIKTVPKAGSPYYMVDKRGTGELEYRRNMENLDMQVQRPMEGWWDSVRPARSLTRCTPGLHGIPPNEQRPAAFGLYKFNPFPVPF